MPFTGGEGRRQCYAEAQKRRRANSPFHEVMRMPILRGTEERNQDVPRHASLSAIEYEPPRVPTNPRPQGEAPCSVMHAEFLLPRVERKRPWQGIRKLATAGPASIVCRTQALPGGVSRQP